MAKQKKQDGNGWDFPAALEIIKCKEGNKEYMRERPARKPFGRMVKICEYSLDSISEFDGEDDRAIWKLAKRAARDFLRISWLNAAIVTATKTDKVERVVIVYGRY